MQASFGKHSNYIEAVQGMSYKQPKGVLLLVLVNMLIRVGPTRYKTRAF